MECFTCALKKTAQKKNNKHKKKDTTEKLPVLNVCVKPVIYDTLCVGVHVVELHEL
jgi:hypothetical protein